MNDFLSNEKCMTLSLVCSLYFHPRSATAYFHRSPIYQLELFAFLQGPCILIAGGFMIYFRGMDFHYSLRLRGTGICEILTVLLHELKGYNEFVLCSMAFS